MHKHEIDIQQVTEFVNSCNTDTRIYIGCDSERLNINGVWFADFVTAVVVHIDGKNGCKIFGAVKRERDHDQRVDRPRMRLMTEVYMVADLYLKLNQLVANDIEIHLDINPDEMHNSSIVINEAVGYIRGMCDVIPMVKPNAWAASSVADRFKTLKCVNE